MSSCQNIAVLGAGHWGVALAAHLARQGRQVRLWGHRPEPLLDMRASARLTAELALPSGLTPTPNLAEAIQDSQMLLLVVPSRFFRSVLQQAKAHITAQHVLVWASKGLELDSGLRLDQVVQQTLPGIRAAAISGPTFAAEVMAGLPAAMTAASTDPQVAEQVAECLRGPTMRVYISDDLCGICLGGAIKNVMAIAAGISDGLGFGHNARAALITRGLAELIRLGKALGGKPETFMGLAGAGDLILTCTGDLSRNRTVGLRLGQGEKLDTILADLRMEAEGVHTAKALYHLAQIQHIDMPIVEQVYRVLYEGLDPKAAQRALMERPPRQEG